jgi:hypothetical protein
MQTLYYGDKISMDVSKVKLEDLVPEGAEFKLKKTEKTYRLKPFSLSDELWMNKVFGNDIEKIFREVRMKEVCRIVFHQLEDEDKEDFLARDVTVINEQGEKLTQRLGGAELFSLFISGQTEKIKIFEALLQTIGISRPMLDEFKKDSESSTEKKTEDQ